MNYGIIPERRVSVEVEKRIQQCLASWDAVSSGEWWSGRKIPYRHLCPGTRS